MSTNEKIAVGYNGNQLDGITLNIDYLIVNLVGALDFYKIDFGASNISIEANPYGTKVFESSHDIYFNKIKMGVILSHPRSKILDPFLCQFQFENNLFYLNELSNLKDFLWLFTDLTGLYFQSINRLDIAIDRTDLKGDYRQLMRDLLDGSKLISGREKNVRCEYLTVNGRMVMNGFTIGKRSSSRFLRCYNKTLEMSIKPKEWIYKNWQNNNVDTTSVWRFEYQLNNTFFTYLQKSSLESITWCIFDNLCLLELIQKAEKNHFEVKLNTNKVETNKEQTFNLFDWENIKLKISNQRKVCITRIKRTISSSLLVCKRFVKACFREYYISRQNIAFILPLNHFLQDIVSIDEKRLISLWFHSKVPFYIKEFQQKDVANAPFNYSSFLTDLKLYI